MTDKETKSINRQIRRTKNDIEFKVQCLKTDLSKNPRDMTPGPWDPHSVVFTSEDDGQKLLGQDANAWRAVSYRAKRIQEATEKLDELCRQRDGRPTRREEAIADSNRMEANMAAEAHRERREWAWDETMARYDSINEQDRDCGPTYNPDQE